MRVVRAIGVLVVVPRAWCQKGSCDDTCVSAPGTLCRGDTIPEESTWYEVCYPSTSTSKAVTVTGGLKYNGAVVDSTTDVGRVRRQRRRPILSS